uniref:Uncharacterized protein n=1 Tax=Megaselia scalaris TaxID=36166 RepID=T1H3C8_MEGSC
MVCKNILKSVGEVMKNHQKTDRLRLHLISLEVHQQLAAMTQTVPKAQSLLPRLVHQKSQKKRRKTKTGIENGVSARRRKNEIRRSPNLHKSLVPVDKVSRPRQQFQCLQRLLHQIILRLLKATTLQ